MIERGHVTRYDMHMIVVPAGGWTAASATPSVAECIDGWWRISADCAARIDDLLADRDEVLVVAVGDDQLVVGVWPLRGLDREAGGSYTFAFGGALARYVGRRPPVRRQQGVRYVSPSGAGRDAFVGGDVAAA